MTIEEIHGISIHFKWNSWDYDVTDVHTTFENDNMVFKAYESY